MEWKKKSGINLIWNWIRFQIWEIKQKQKPASNGQPVGFTYKSFHVAAAMQTNSWQKKKTPPWRPLHGASLI